MKCKRCRRAEAAVELPSHHAAFCPDCFLVFFRRQVTEGIRKLRLLAMGTVSSCACRAARTA